MRAPHVGSVIPELDVLCVAHGPSVGPLVANRVGRDLAASVSEPFLRSVTAARLLLGEQADSPTCSRVQEVPLAAQDPSERC